MAESRSPATAPRTRRPGDGPSRAQWSSVARPHRTELQCPAPVRGTAWRALPPALEVLDMFVHELHAFFAPLR